jgi:hypothetical protein
MLPYSLFSGMAINTQLTIMVIITRALNRVRSTDNTMAKRKGDKTANNNLQSTT